MVAADMTAIAPSVSPEKKRKRAGIFRARQGFKNAETQELVSFCCVTLIVCIDFIGVGIQGPLLPFYFEEFPDAREIDVGFATSLLAFSFTSSQFISTPIFGLASDRFGRRPLMLLSVLGSFVFFAGQGFASSFKMLCIMRFLTGLFGGSRPVAVAYIGDTIAPEHQPKYLAVLSCCVSLSLFLSPALGGSMGLINLALPCFFQSGASAVVGLISLVYLHEGQRNPGGAKAADTSGQAAARPWKLWAAANAFVGAALTYFTVNWGMLFPIIATSKWQLDQNKIGLIMGSGGLMIAVAQFTVFVPLSKKVGLPVIGCLGVICSCAPCALLVYSEQAWFAIILSCMHGFGMALVLPGVTVIVNYLAPAARRGLSVSLTMMFQAGSSVVAPLVGGPMYDISWTLPLIIMFAICALALLFEALLVLRIPVIGAPANKKKDDDARPREDKQEEEEKKMILANLQKVHDQLNLALNWWIEKRSELQLGKSPEELGFPPPDSEEPEITEEQKSKLGSWMAEMLFEHGYKDWQKHVDLIQCTCRNAFPKIRDVELKRRADDLVYILQSHLILEQRWERFVLSNSDLADLPEFHVDSDPLMAPTGSEVQAGADGESFKDLSLRIWPEAQIAYV